MKIKTKKLSYDEVMALPKPEHKKPLKPNIIFRTLIRLLSVTNLMATKFSYTMDERIDLKKGPYLILMNHSSFIDLKIAYKILYPRPVSIVCTSDGFVGKSLLMRLIGCIPTQKFVTDMTLIRDIKYALKEKKSNVLMYPEASYSFDGKATPLPRGLGRLLKTMGVPVVMITTHGAFARDPLYNGLRLRKVKVSADVKLLASAEEIKAKSVDELDGILDEAFGFDNFKWQEENGVKVDEPFRAIGLERILYKCASCGEEGHMLGHGMELTCSHCGKKYTLTEFGKLEAHDGEPAFTHIPDWFDWERSEVRREIENGEYLLDTDVDIAVMVDYKAIYKVGEGHLIHDKNGFTLTGCDGKLHYEQKPLYNYGLYSDYYWYEIGDVICIGNADALYYCFPKKEGVVAKTRLAAEEMFKLAYAEHHRARVKV